MRIIVEGPDGAGKTTLVEYLHSLFDFEIICNPKGPDQNFEWWWPETLILKGSRPDTTVIHDRFFYSELVYGPVIRGRVVVSNDLIRTTQAQLRQSAMLIYARPSEAALAQGVRVADQMEGVAEKHTKLIEAYDDLMTMEQFHYGKRFYRYDWRSDKEPRSVVEHVKRFLRGELV